MKEPIARPHANGRCLCGGVRYTVQGPLRPPLECHCRTCRRFTGGLWHGTAAYRDHVAFHEETTLRWYASSPGVRRGFCGECGAGLFVDVADERWLALAAGALEPPTGLRLAARIWTREAGDYYTLGAEVPAGADATRAVNEPDGWEPARALGACHCGNVQYGIEGPLRQVVECHCGTCRRFTGGLWHATAARREDIIIHDEGTLAWYASSAHARRGFCGRCGASLFMEPVALPFIAATAGTLHEPTGLRLAARIFTADGADYGAPGEAVAIHADGQHGLLVPEA